MPDIVLGTIGLLLLGPLAAMGLVPVWSLLLSLIGAKGRAHVESIEVIGQSAASVSAGSRSVYRVVATLQTNDGPVKYSMRRIFTIDQIRDVEAISGKDVTFWCLPWLAKIIGWNVWTVRLTSDVLRSGVLLLMPFWFLGVLPLAAILYWMATGDNLIFRLLRLFG